MKTTDFSFELPPELIAYHPSEERGGSRLLLLERGTGDASHHRALDLPSLLPEGALLVFNDTRVRKARLVGTDPHTGTQREFLLLAPLAGSGSGARWKALVKYRRRLKEESVFAFAGGRTARIGPLIDGARVLTFSAPIDDAWLEAHGRIPLPPYIRRACDAADDERYQTVYAKEIGSAAAPTAGLHFSAELLSALRARGIQSAYVTLHIGLGTFLPVRTETVEEHTMHSEPFFIGEEAAWNIESAKREGRKIVAVGTTSVRALESAWHDGRLARGAGSTNIFIYGAHRFNVVDALFTNFHTPESTLLMLASAFCAKDGDADGGRKLLLETYRTAIKRNYRFFSYGDAMLIV
ncbi:MAG: tRNA preQ1(34) S-adenosylmethionine ribosyltransferase-isomerase QueA [Spirochaetaceae bacterium]|jgi:S-adenosylmethionine:tRNA ribosyltransferase-isomerase|nr:tRNA preQ1(34) S-adenosylmethionine ribosyltransferase-isomerase QueA [Spirochaetaceae bacterium]